MTTIIGHGYVGRAVHSILNEEPRIVDPEFNDNQIEADDVYFICVPTPDNNGECDTSIVESVLSRILEAEDHAGVHGLIVLKSTVPPSFFERPRDLVYWPEFLTEQNWELDALNPSMTVLGGDDGTLLEWLQNNTMSTIGKVHNVTCQEASYIKYSINSFLATKVVFFNELYDNCPGDWDKVRDAITTDPRIGWSHTMVPGTHGRGYAGSCFTKDVKAFLDYKIFQVLAVADIVNTRLRDADSSLQLTDNCNNRVNS